MIINGREIAARILQDVKTKSIKRNLCMTAILVGEDPNLHRFVEIKRKAAEMAGIEFRVVLLNETIEEEEAEKVVDRINSDVSVNGIFIELPLPNHLDKSKILNLISIGKDVDILSKGARDIFEKGDLRVLPPTVFAVNEVMREFNINPSGKRVAIFGTGELVGKPMAIWFKKKGCLVYEIDEFTKNPETISREADIVVSGVGKPDLINKKMVRDGSIVFDFGYGTKYGKIKGDVCDDVVEKVSLLTPVPGGVGPLVVAAIFSNLLLLNEP